MITCGFYNSIGDDRLYDALDVSRIFDGIINDGIYMSIGTCMRVTAIEGNNLMAVNVGIGRAWFNHTWTLNDSILRLEIPISEIVLNRIDAVVLEVSNDPNIRNNTIKVVKGTPSKTPTRPTMINTELTKQYPLAFVDVSAGVRSIRTANITNMVGTSSTPYVTGIIETINIDSLVAQWGDQWREWFDRLQANGEGTLAELEDSWNTWYTTITTTSEATLAQLEKNWNDWYTNITTKSETDLNNLEKKWNDWYDNLTTTSEATLNTLEDSWNDWYTNITNQGETDLADLETKWNTWYTNITTTSENSLNSLEDSWNAWYNATTEKGTNDLNTFLANSQTRFDNWFVGLQKQLDENTAARLTAKVMALEESDTKQNGEINAHSEAIKDIQLKLQNIDSRINTLLQHAILDSSYVLPSEGENVE